MIFISGTCYYWWQDFGVWVRRGKQVSEHGKAHLNFYNDQKSKNERVEYQMHAVLFVFKYSGDRPQRVLPSIKSFTERSLKKF